MYGRTILINKPVTTALEFVLVMKLHISLFDFDN